MKEITEKVASTNEIEEMILYNRFISVVNKLSLSAAKIKEEVPGFDIEYISRILMGNETLTLIFLKKFLAKYEISANYIFTGKGEMYFKEADEKEMSPYERLSYICQDQNINMNNLAKEIGRSPIILYNIKSGKIKSISDSMANAIVKKYPIYNYSWVKSGINEIKKQELDIRDIKIDSLLSFYPILLQTLDNIEQRISKLEESTQKNMKKNTA